MKNLFQIVSEKAEESINPVLSFRIGQNHCCFAIVEKDSAVLKALYYYCNENINVSRLDEILSLHPRLQHDFHSILVGYDYTQNFLSPASHINRMETADFQGDIIPKHQSSIKLIETISRRELENTYWVPSTIHDWVTSKFRNGKYRHHDSILLEQVLNDSETGQLYVDFRNEEFVLMVSRENRLLLLQVYGYATPGDVLYFLLKSCHFFSLDQKVVTVYLSGLIDINSSLYNELYQYFVNIRFREAKWNAPPSEFPAHFFTSLNDLSRCE